MQHGRTSHGRRSFTPWVLAACGVSGLGLVAVFGLVVAVLGATFTTCQPTAETVNATGPEASKYATENIPPARLRIYQEAGARFDIDWSFLASIGTQECGSAGDCRGTNSAGCAGPMQIAFVRGSPCSPGAEPTLWERYGVSAHGGRSPDINDPADAIYTAARILREDKGAPPTGGSFAEYHEAACHYYGACGDSTVAYADEVMARAIEFGFTGSGAPPASSPSLAEPAPGPVGGCSISNGVGGLASTAIVGVAEGQVGSTEHPPGSNCTIYGPCEEWCSFFAVWVWQHAGVPIPGSTDLYGYSGFLFRWVREHGGTILPPDAEPAPGDAVFYGAGPGSSAHVGIVVRVLANGEIETVEGNYGGRVASVGPFPPKSPVGEAGPIYGYAEPPTEAEIKQSGKGA